MSFIPKIIINNPLIPMIIFWRKLVWIFNNNKILLSLIVFTKLITLWLLVFCFKKKIGMKGVTGRPAITPTHTHTLVKNPYLLETNSQKKTKEKQINTNKR